MAKSQKDNSERDSQSAEHFCKYEDKINEMHLMLTSNGLVSQVAIISDRQQGIIKILDKIDSSLTEVRKDNDNLLVDISALRGEIKGKEKAEKTIWQKAVWIITILIITITGGFGIYFGFRNLTKKVDNMGIPVVTNPRGEKIVLPLDAKIKFWPKDFTKDSIK